MSQYDLMVQFGEDWLPLSVPKRGTFRDLKRAYEEVYGVPISNQIWAGRIGDLGVGDDFPLSAMGLDNCEPLQVFSSGDYATPSPPARAQPANTDFGDPMTVDDSDDMAAAIAASLAETRPTTTTTRIPISTGPSRKPPSHPRTPVTVEEIESISDEASQGYAPIVVDSDTDDSFDDSMMDEDGLEEVIHTGTRYKVGNDGLGMGMGAATARPGRRDSPNPVVPPAIPAESPWRETVDLMNRMGEMGNFGMNFPSGTGEAVGYLGPGNFVKMPFVGREKQALITLLNESVVVPMEWRIKFPSRAMGGASPFHYANRRFDDLMQDSKEQELFMAVHLFNSASDSSDFYNMIVLKEEVQATYAENYLCYYCYLSPLEQATVSRLLSPSLPRATALALPLVLLMGTLGGKLTVFDIADSSSTWSSYLDQLMVTRMTYLPTIQEQEMLDRERRAQTSLVDEQNSAFERSQREDLEREQRAEAEAARVAREAEEARLAQEAEKQLVEDQAMISANTRAYHRQMYLDELAALPAEPTTGRNTTIALRLVDGSKAQRKFDPETTTLAQVFSFAAGTIASKATDDNFCDPNDSNAAWDINNFDLSSQFPSKRFTHADEAKTLIQLGLTGQVLLNIVPVAK